MELDKVRLLNKKQLLEKLEQNGFELLANILRDKEINGEQLLDLTEFETIKWRLSLGQKRMLFNCINELKDNPSTILKGPTPKLKYGVSKAPPPKPSRIHQKEPPSLKPIPKTSNFSEDHDKAAFKQKLGTLFEGSFEFRPISPARTPGLSGQDPSAEIPAPPRFRKFDGTQPKAGYPDPAGFDTQVAPSNDIPTPPRFKKIDDTRQLASSDPPNDQIPAPRDVDGTARLPLSQSKITTRANSPLKDSNAKNKRKLPLPVEPQRPIQATTLPRPKVVDSGKSRTMDIYKPKPPLPPPMEAQTTIPTRSTNSVGSKTKLPVPSSVEQETARRNFLSPKKWEVSSTTPKQNISKSEEEEMYVDMGHNQLDSNYGYLSPIDIASPRSGSPFADSLSPPFLPPRNGSPNFQSHGSDEGEPTYHDPDEKVYEQAPTLKSFDDVPTIPSVINRKPPPLSSRGVDNSKINMEFKMRNLDSQTRVTINKNEDRQSNGFIKKLFKKKGKFNYENVEIESKMEHRVSVTHKIQPRPLPPVPTRDVSPNRGQIPVGEIAGYIELTLHPPEAEELYANYDEKGAKVRVDEDNEVNYSNTQELQSRPQHFPSPLSPKKYINKQSPDDLAAKLAQDLKARVWHNKVQSDDTEGSDFEEDEEFPEQIYSNEHIEDSKAYDSNLPLQTIHSVNNKVTDKQKQVNATATNRNNQQIFQVENSNVNEEFNDEIYENLPESSSNNWQARSLLLPPPPQINKIVTTGRENRSVLNTNSPQFTPVKKKSIVEVEKEENSADQVYGNIEAEKSHPEKSQENSIFHISNEPYYRDTDRKGAKQLLRTLGNGAFLFRPSEKHFLVLSAKHNGKFYNFGIERSQNGKIRLTADTNSDVPEFSSLKEFVEYFSKEALTFQEETSLAEIYLRPVLPPNAF